MAFNRVGIGIIGCGYWGINYVRIFSELRDSHVVAVCDRRASRLAIAAKRFPDVRLTNTVDDLLRLTQIDALVVCTDIQSHYEIALRCLDSGRPVLIEKPMATCVNNALELINSSDRHNLTLMIGHALLHHVAIRRLKQMVNPRYIGRLYYLYSRRTNLGPAHPDICAVWQLATHDVAVFNYLIGKMPQSVSAIGTTVGAAGGNDVGFATLDYGNRLIANIHVSRLDAHKVREIVAVGSNQRIVFDDATPGTPLTIYEKSIRPLNREAESYGEFQFLVRDGDIIRPQLPASEPLKNQCRHFLECIRHNKRPLTDGISGVEVVHVMQAIERSLAQHGVPVSIEPLFTVQRYSGQI